MACWLAAGAALAVVDSPDSLESLTAGAPADIADSRLP